MLGYAYIETEMTHDDVMDTLRDAGFGPAAASVASDPASADAADTWDLITNWILPAMSTDRVPAIAIDDELDTAYIVVGELA